MLATIGVVYWNVLVELVEAWSTDDNYSHGFFIAPLALYFAWERRQTLAAEVFEGLVVTDGAQGEATLA